MNHPLAIVGASTRAAAASAARAGFRPIAADLFADADLRAIATATRISPYPEGLVDWLRAIEPPAWMYTGALENHPELVDQMAWIAPLWGNPGDVLARVRSPRELATVLAKHDLLFPETRDSSEGLPRDGSWLAKTYRGASGSGVRALDEARDECVAPSEHEADGSFSASGREVVFQRRISGTPCAAVFVGAEGMATLLGVTRQIVGENWLRAHGFQYAGSIGPWPMAEKARTAIARLGNVVAEEFELIGLFGVDFVLDGDDVWTIEVNPRFTASVEIVERMTGRSALAAHAAACGGAAVEDHTSVKWSAAGEGAHGKAILFARDDMVMSERLAAYALEQAARSPWPALGDVSPAGTPIDAGRPILTLFAEGANIDEVELRLRDTAADIETRIATDGA